MKAARIKVLYEIVKGDGNKLKVYDDPHPFTDVQGFR